MVAALVLPAAAMPFLPRKAVSPDENRRLAAPPAAPRTLEDWRTVPRAVDAFLADHFGFREPMMKAANAGWRQLGGAKTGQGAVEGRDGWLFLTAGLLGESFVGLSPGGDPEALKPGDEIAYTTPSVDLIQMVGKYMFSGGGSSSAPASQAPTEPAPAGTPDSSTEQPQ